MQPVIEIIEPVSLFDAINGKKFVDIVNKALKSGSNVILVDFKEVNFTDSAGLASLVIALKSTHAIGVKFAICSMGEQLEMLLKMTSMTEVFEIFDDREAFLRQFLQGFPEDALLENMVESRVSRISQQ